MVCLSKMVKHMGFCNFFASIFSKNVKKHNVFASFEKMDAKKLQNPCDPCVFSFFEWSAFQELQKHEGFCNFVASIFSIKVKNTMFFLHFLNRNLSKKLKARCFLQFLIRFWAKKGKTRGGSHFFAKMCRQKIFSA